MTTPRWIVLATVLAADLKTVDVVHTRYGGSEATPRTPTAIDPRQVVARSRLEADPRLMEMWAGYAFARDFREERGHVLQGSSRSPADGGRGNARAIHCGSAKRRTERPNFQSHIRLWHFDKVAKDRRQRVGR